MLHPLGYIAIKNTVCTLHKHPSIGILGPIQDVASSAICRFLVTISGFGWSFVFHLNSTKQRYWKTLNPGLAFNSGSFCAKNIHLEAVLSVWNEISLYAKNNKMIHTPQYSSSSKIPLFVSLDCASKPSKQINVNMADLLVEFVAAAFFAFLALMEKTEELCEKLRFLSKKNRWRELL